MKPAISGALNDRYNFIYSSVQSHERCYATATDPAGPFSYGGTIISNGDIGYNQRKTAGTRTAFIGNNHGSLAEIAGHVLG